ncbi:MAG: cellulose binding domain-containing protein, partial [Mycobacterium sp.]
MLSAGSSKYIGRVGALAVALGIGGAVAITPGVAWADDSSPSGASGAESASSTESAPAPKARAERTHQRIATREDAAPTRTADSSTRGRGSVDLAAPAATAQRGSDRGSRQLPTALAPEVSLAQIDTSSDARTITAPSPAASAASAVDRFIAAAPRAAAAAAAAAQPAAVSGFLSALSTTLSGNGTGTPAGPLNFLTAALSLVSREINRLTSSYAPVAQSVQTGQQVTAARTTASAVAAASVSSSPSATYAVSSDWGSGFTGNVTVAAGPTALNGWTVSFNTPAEITNLWNGVISSHVGTAYVVTNADW